MGILKYIMMKRYLKYYDGTQWQVCNPWGLKVYLDGEWKYVRFQG